MSNYSIAQYQQDAVRTLSTRFDGALVPHRVFVETLDEAIKVLNTLDKIKKALFYGRAVRFDAQPGDKPTKNLQPRDADIVHALIGVATEAGEMLEIVCARIGGSTHEFDNVHVIEELGDAMWYIAIALLKLNTDFETCAEINIEKLKARFPKAFNADSANNRDLVKERTILEQGVDKPKA